MFVKLTPDVIKDGVVEDEAGQSDLLQSLFSTDFAVELKSGKHDIRPENVDFTNIKIRVMSSFIRYFNFS